MLDILFIIPCLLAKIIDLVLPGSNFELDSLNGLTHWPIPGAHSI